MFAIRREILQALLDDAEWSRRLEQARTMQQVERVIREFAQAKGFRIKEIVE